LTAEFYELYDWIKTKKIQNGEADGEIVMAENTLFSTIIISPSVSPLFALFFVHDES
jgi:hypothetical protein